MFDLDPGEFNSLTTGNVLLKKKEACIKHFADRVNPVTLKTMWKQGLQGSKLCRPKTKPSQEQKGHKTWKIRRVEGSKILILLPPSTKSEWPSRPADCLTNSENEIFFPSYPMPGSRVNVQ